MSSAVGDVVRQHRDARGGVPLLVLEPLEAFLDAPSIGAGPIAAEPIGDGHSNVTYRLARDGACVVLRRPPRGPLPPSAHDVLREARLLARLRPAGARVPEVLACCDDPAVIGAPFYVLEHIEGHVFGPAMPRALPIDERSAFGTELVDTLVELHAVDPAATGLEAFGRSSGYLERQLRRFRGLLETTATRPPPLLDAVADRLVDTMPDSSAVTVVHGD